MSNIKDVAAHAGVSFKTVARVVNNEPTVRETTKQKVLASIEALNYRPNASAKMMRNSKSGVFGIIMETNTSMAPAIDILHQAQKIARQHNKLVVAANVNKQDRAQAIEQLLSLRVEGIIYATMYHREVELPVELKDIPTILVNCFCADKSVPSITPNEYRAGFELTQRMINKGYKNIAFLNLSEKVVASKERLRGYLDALSMADVTPSPDLYPYAEIVIDDRAEHHTEEALDQLMALPVRPDAIVCGKDSIALDCYIYFAKKGLSIGKDIAIGSFDNDRQINFNLKPALSTMDLPHCKMGEMAMHYLLNGELTLEPTQVRWDFVHGASF
jgi:LacI family transcriptional regulator